MAPFPAATVPKRERQQQHATQGTRPPVQTLGRLHARQPSATLTSDESLYHNLHTDAAVTQPSSAANVSLHDLGVPRTSVEPLSW